MKKNLDLQYVAHITTITNKIKETYQSNANTMRELIAELDHQYKGIQQVFVNPKTGQINLNAMIYYKAPNQFPVTVINLEDKIEDRSTITFW